MNYCFSELTTSASLTRLTGELSLKFSLSIEQLFPCRERRLSEHLVDVEVRKVMRFRGENPKNEGKNEKINISW